MDKLYLVIWHNDHQDVYHVRPINGGEVKVINRKLLREVPSDTEAVELNEDNFRFDPNFTDVHVHDKVCPRKQQDKYMGEYTLVPNFDKVGIDPVGEDVAGRAGDDNVNVPGNQDGAIPRRSQRQTKGRHSNPFNLPKSVLR